MLSIYIYNNNFSKYKTEQRFLQKLGYNNITTYINDLMCLGFEYSFYAPLVLTLESTKSHFFTSPLVRFNELLKINFNIKDFNILNLKKKLNNNVYLSFLELLNSFNHINAFSNALYLMVNSGAKANMNQIYQLVGLRGYLSNFSGKIFKIPILNSFNKGLNLFEYFISCYGARKGILDSALKTADSGYLTRRLVELSQEIILKEYKCNSKNSIKYTIYIDFKGNFNLSVLLLGKYLKNNLVDLKTKKILEIKDTYVTEKSLNKLLHNFKKKYILKINTNSVKLCSAGRSICSVCYGFTNFKTNQLGKNLGVLAGQVIGEPGTQMTLRTFHTGGSYTKKFENNNNILLENYIHKKYYLFLKNINFKLCSTHKKKKSKLFNTISYLIVFKQRYFKLNNFLIYMITKLKYNKIFSLKNKLLYIKNNIYLSIFWIKYLNILKIYQRKNPEYTNYKYIYGGEYIFKNLLQLIFKNQYNQWIALNLNTNLIFKNLYIWKPIQKHSIILMSSKNNKYNKFYVELNNNNLYSYKLVKFKNINYMLLPLLYFSNNYLYKINKNWKKKIKNYKSKKYDIFKKYPILLKYKKVIIHNL